MPDPTPLSWTPINMWAMLRSLINNYTPILNNAGAPTNGTSGTAAGQAGPGALLLDYTNGVLYINQGTLASPIWNTVSGAVSGLQGAGAVGNAKMTYDFAVNGGAISTITPTNSPILPIGAIILGGVIDITTTLTGAGNSTGLGFGSGAQVNALKAQTVVASWTAGTTLVMIPIFTSATYYKLTAAAAMSMTISGGALTAGKFDVNLVYVLGN